MKINPKDDFSSFMKKLLDSKPAMTYFVLNRDKKDLISVSAQTIIDIVRRSVDDLEIQVSPDELVGTSLELTFILGDGETFGIPPTVGKRPDDFKNFCAALSVADSFDAYPRTDGKFQVDISYHQAFHPLTKKDN